MINMNMTHKQFVDYRKDIDRQQASQAWWNHSGMLDINASSETVYPRSNNNSMNKKLEAAKKWLKHNET